MKKLPAILCAAALVLSLAVPSFAEKITLTQVDSYSSINNVAGGISFIERASDLDSLSAVFEKEVYPSAMIFTVDADLNVITKDGESLGYRLIDGLRAIDGYARPVIEANDRDTVAAVSHLVSASEMHDYFLMSRSAKLLKYAHDRYIWSCGILDRSDLKSVPTEKALAKISGEVAASYSSVVLFSSEAVNADSIRYLFSRTVLTWTQNEGEMTDTDALRTVLSGTFGVVSTETERLHRAATEMIEPNTVTRKPLCVAHRGSPFHAPENTVESVTKAMEEGADAVEIDIRLTGDGAVILSHEPNTGYACKVGLDIATSTLEEIQALNANCGMDEKYPSVKIPTFEEMLRAVMYSDIITYVEIKDGNPETTRRACELIRRYGYMDRVVFISFYPEQLHLAKQCLPEVPTSLLGGYYTDSGDPSWDVSEMIAFTRPMGFSFSPAYNETFTVERSAECFAHGFDMLLWTFSAASDMYDPFRRGYISLTTNDPTAFYVYPITSSADLSSPSGVLHTNKPYEASGKLTTYSGDEMDVRDHVFAFPDDDGVTVSEDGASVTFTSPGKHTVFEGCVFKGGGGTYTVYAENTFDVAEFRGDVNGDGSVNAKDVSLMLRHTAGFGVDFDEYAADANADGTVNAKDVTEIMKYIAGF